MAHNILSQGPRTNFGPFSSLADFVSPVTSRAGRAEARAEVQSAGTAAFRQAVLDATNQGQDVATAVMGVLNTEVGQAALNDPAFPKNSQDFLKLISPQPEPTISKSAAPTSEFEKFSGEERKQFFGVGPPDPTAAEKLTDAILEAEARARKGDQNAKREVELLTQHLPKDPTTGEMGLKEFAVLTAAGIKVKNPPADYKGMSLETANTVLKLLQVPRDRALNQAELILIGLDEIKNENVSPEAAEATVIIQDEIRTQQRNSDLAQIFALTGQTDLAEQMTGGETDLKELFRKHREGAAVAPSAKPGTPLPGSAATAPGASPGVPIAGTNVPAVGGKGGQAQGPTFTIQVDPQVAKQFEGLTPEQFAGLDLNTLATITQAHVNKQINLTPEQAAALLAAITAANVAEAGGAGGGTR